jgi:tRNA (guanine37-N1)-methyltransferase
MVMLIDPLRDAIAAARAAVGTGAGDLPESAGRRLTQETVRELAQRQRLVLLCGRYEGIDERLFAHAVDEELSIGDYVLSGGELAAAVVIDAIGRLQEGALNDAQSAQQDSFSDGLLDCPHYTRPERHDGATCRRSDSGTMRRSALAQETGSRAHLATASRPAGLSRFG